MAAHKICPICGTRAHRAAAVCQTCGASLTDVPASGPRPVDPALPADLQYGDDDLLERRAARTGRRLFSFVLAALALVLVFIAGIAFAAWNSARDAAQAALTPAIIVSPTIALVFETNTPAPSPVIATITPMPPTATMTASPSPCSRVVQANDTLTSIIFNCGYRSLDVLPLVLELNNLASAEVIQQGQTIIVPLPTVAGETGETGSAERVIDPLSGATADPLVIVDAALDESAVGPTDTPPPAITPTETMLPGVGIHIVQPDESMVSIAYQYRTNAETLSQLNPQIPFSQCDFSLDSGGPRCTVLIGIGQMMRVPVPTPTPSHTPTLTGSETPTPLPTPTYNAPNLIAPENRVFFLRDELITLRWIGTGSLADSETYLVIVENTTSGQSFTAQTRDLAYVIPPEWQAENDIPADYRWSVGVITVSDPDSVRYLTPPRFFTWQGRAETSEN